MGFLFFSSKLLVDVAFLLNQDGICVSRPIPRGKKSPTCCFFEENVPVSPQGKQND